MRVDISHTKKKDNWKVLCSMVRKVFRLHGEEINLKVESSFSLNMTKKKKGLSTKIHGIAFCSLQLLLHHFTMIIYRL